MSEESSDDRLRRENLIDYRLRRIEKSIINQEARIRNLEDLSISADIKSYSTRIRSLEDFRLSSKLTHRNLAKWITIATTSFAGSLELILHLLLK